MNGWKKLEHHSSSDVFLLKGGELMPAKIIDFTAPHKRKTESEIEISKVEKMALDNKMSYGQYIAMIEEEKKKGYTQQ